MKVGPGEIMRDRRTVFLPPRETEASIREWLGALHADREDPRVRAELAAYLDGDVRRFLNTLGLVPQGRGRLLEVGADPYFTTALLRRFREYELFLTNGQGEKPRDNPFRWRGVDGRAETLTFARFNLEIDSLPWPAGHFDVALCCEVIEHMGCDPVGALGRLNEALRPGGTLVLTTPNAARLGIVASALAGVHSVHDQYSAYGPYGRHAREYTPREMLELVSRAGFEVEEAFTADARTAGAPGAYAALGRLSGVVGAAVAAARWTASTLRLLPGPPAGLGAYQFFRARKVRSPEPRKPRWLYRSYPESEMAPEQPAG